MNKRIFLLASLAVAVASARAEEKLPVYQTVPGVSGNLNSIGSDTLNNLMALWSEAFKAKYPNVNIQVEGKGSATAPPALIEGTAQLGPMSRAMKKEEIDAFEAKYGYKPLEIKVAVDALAVFAHKDNPLKGLTIQQVDAIFSSTRKKGGASAITDWGQLDLKPWEGQAISLYGRNSASGTYGFFKDEALGKGDFNDKVKEQPGSSAVVQGVAGDQYALGYSGIGYLTSGVRALPLGESADSLVEANKENCLSGDYPLARFLFIYVNKKPGAELDKLTKEFLTFVISEEGQKVVEKDGYFALPAELASEILKSLAK